MVGWECSLFRNEGSVLSSKVILACEAFVEGKVFTYVNPKRVQSCNAGYCFKMAGWRSLGRRGKKKLVLLVKDLGHRAREGV